MALQRVQSAQPAAAELLSLCAFLAPDDIPIDLIRDGREYFPEVFAAAVADPLIFDEAIAALRRYSLLEVDANALSVHRLVQAVAYDRLEGATRIAWAEVAVKLLEHAFPFDANAVETWPTSARLLPHALTAAGYGETWKVAAEQTGGLLDQVGGYFRVRAQFTEARTVRERALAIGEATYGPTHPTVAIDVNNLGRVLRALGDLAGARAAFERALAIDEATYGPTHPTVAIDVNNLGRVLHDLGDLAGARAAFERALQIRQTYLGVEHPSTKTVQANLDALMQESSTSPDTA